MCLQEWLDRFHYTAECDNGPAYNRTVILNAHLSPVYPDTFEMVSEDEDGKLMFKVNYHYMSQVKNASDTNSAARSRRLAQEAVTLSTSLPLSSSSSVFVRCDEERLDIMKVMPRFSRLLSMLGLF